MAQTEFDSFADELEAMRQAQLPPPPEPMMAGWQPWNPDQPEPVEAEPPGPDPNWLPEPTATGYDALQQFENYLQQFAGPPSTGGLQPAYEDEDPFYNYRQDYGGAYAGINREGKPFGQTPDSRPITAPEEREANFTRTVYDLMNPYFSRADRATSVQGQFPGLVGGPNRYPRPTPEWSPYAIDTGLYYSDIPLVGPGEVETPYTGPRWTDPRDVWHWGHGGGARAGVRPQSEAWETPADFRDFLRSIREANTPKPGGSSGFSGRSWEGVG